MKQYNTKKFETVPVTLNAIQPLSCVIRFSGAADAYNHQFFIASSLRSLFGLDYLLQNCN